MFKTVTCPEVAQMNGQHQFYGIVKDSEGIFVIEISFVFIDTFSLFFLQ